MSRLGKSELSYGEYLPVREVLARLDAVDEDAGARGGRRAVRAGDLPGRRRARTASPTSTGSDGAAAPSRSTGALSRGAFAVAVLVSLAVLFAPGRPTCPPRRPGVDKLVHASLFAALALTGRWAGVGAAVLASVLVLYAAASEVLQGLIGAGRRRRGLAGRRRRACSSACCSGTSPRRAAADRRACTGTALEA